jgi:hypothetical protein
MGRWSATGVGTNAGVTVTKTAIAGQTPSVTGIQCSGDSAAIVTVESPAATILYRKRFAAAFTFSDAWPLGNMPGASGAAVLVKISASTSNCEANIQGVNLHG